MATGMPPEDLSWFRPDLFSLMAGCPFPPLGADGAHWHTRTDCQLLFYANFTRLNLHRFNTCPFCTARNEQEAWDRKIAVRKRRTAARAARARTIRLRIRKKAAQAACLKEVAEIVAQWEFAE